MDTTADRVKPDVSVHELRDQLDALWEKHLTLVDSYHKAQQQLSSHFSSGFFDLAQATFKSTTRVRYGQEYYDDRMQATRCFQAEIDDNDLPCLTLNAEDASPSPDSSNKHETKSTENSPQKEEAEENKTDEPEQQPTPPSTPPPSKEEEKLPKEQPEQDKPKPTTNKDKAQKKPRDPLHWYGILVPPSLRASQKSFISAIESPVIEAANSAQALRHVATEIRKLRKDIKKAERRVV